MKKTLRIALPFIVIGLLITLFLGILGKLKTKRMVEQAIATLPVQSYVGVDSIAYTLQNPQKQIVFVLFFNSHCDYCQIEAKLLSEHRQSFKNATVYLFSIEPLENIRAFKDKYLQDNTDFIVGQINAMTSSEVFGVKSFPYILIYDKNNRLINTYKGIVKLEALTQYIDTE